MEEKIFTEEEITKIKESLSKLYFGCGTIILTIGFFFLKSWIVQLLYNNIVSDVFILPELSYWQTVGILLLINFTFKVKSNGLVNSFVKK